MSDRVVRWRASAGRLWEPALVSGVLAAVYLLTAPSTADFAAQTFRVGLFENQGFAAWDNLWFGGHHLPGYGFILPLLGSIFSPRLVAAVAVVLSALIFAEIVYARWGERARIGVVWFAASASISLFTGRLTFAVGIALALGAVLALQRGKRGFAIALALLCPFGSPVAALFLACAGLTYAAWGKRREGLEIAVASAGMVALVSLVFPEGGTEPFVLSSFLPAFVMAIIAFLCIPRQERLLRLGVAAYGLLLLVAFTVDSPMGGNATRLGALFLGPLFACALWQRQRMILFLLAPFAVYWQLVPVVRDLETVQAQPSVQPGYYAPVADYLRGAMDDREYRVEVVPSSHHWEAAYMPKGIYIARGWQRQLDRKLNPLFYQREIPPGQYRKWLDSLAVGYVAVPDSPLDYAGVAEANLIASRPGYLEPVMRNANWTVYAVKDPTPLASGAAELVKIKPQGFILRGLRPGKATVRVRWTRYWTVERGQACLVPSEDGFTQVRVLKPGPIEVHAGFTPWRVLGGGRICSHRDLAADG